MFQKVKIYIWKKVVYFEHRKVLWVSTLDFLSRIVHNSIPLGKVCPGVYVEIGEIASTFLFGRRQTLNEVHVGMDLEGIGRW